MTDDTFDFAVDTISDSRLNGCTVLLAKRFKSRAEADDFKIGHSVAVHVQREQ
jgi:hypothetical protein